MSTCLHALLFDYMLCFALNETKSSTLIDTDPNPFLFRSRTTQHYRHRASPDCNTVASFDSSSSESRNGLNRYYRQAWEVSGIDNCISFTQTVYFKYFPLFFSRIYMNPHQKIPITVHYVEKKHSIHQI